MKKGVLVSFFIILLILNFSFVFVTADENDTIEEVEETISSRGYDCLRSMVEDSCSSLSVEEKIFSSLAIRECKDELLLDALNDECWPKTGCKIKTTAQAILALNELNRDMNDSAQWLISRKQIPPNIDWLLEIESINPTSCTITYSGVSYKINIGQDKKIDRNAGSCLRLYGENYWLEVSESCYEVEFEISCTESFFTTLLYKDQTSSTVYVSEKISSSSGEGRTTEKVDSFCFRQGSTCDYEGSLWAALALNTLGYDTSSYIPYLVTGSDSNQQYLPEVFLYLLLGDSYRTDILLKQRENKWWMESGDKFYDTALALYSFQHESLVEKKNSIDWLEEVQGEDGCWQSNIRNTAFILYSVWPIKAEAEEPSEEEDCEDAGYFCMSKANCEDLEGEELDYEGCFGVNICCSKERVLNTCEEEAGTICDYDEVCIGGAIVEASDLGSGEICCVGGGECRVEEEKEEEEQLTECEIYGGYCRTSCYDDEEERSYDCYSGVCCIEKSTTKKKSYAGIIVFSILIFLVLLGIIFRKKLRKLWFGLKSRFRRKPRGGPAERFPPRRRFLLRRPSLRRPVSSSSPRRILRRTTPRKIIPSQPKQFKKPAPKTKAKGEIEEVLKKLKEIGK
jgi:hypothetical protein